MERARASVRASERHREREREREAQTRSKTGNAGHDNRRRHRHRHQQEHHPIHTLYSYTILFIHSIHIHSIHMLSLPTCQHPSASDVAQTYLVVGNHALGAGFMHTEVWRRKCKLGPTKKFPVRFLLGWPEFIFPPPHLSLKTPYPQGVVSYDQPALVHACMQAHEQLPRAL